MDLSFKHIDEKDIDMLLMDRISKGGPILELLIREVESEMPGDPRSYSLLGVEHSATTRNGESDLLVMLAGPGGKHAILIEDKIDALAQHDQAKRYERRGREGVSAGDWRSYSIVLVAPEGYLELDSEPYPHRLSYQRIRDVLADDDAFAHRMLSDAVIKQASGWQRNRNEIMSAFYDEVARTAKKMRIKAECTHKVGMSRAKETAWVDFKSPLNGSYISWKSNQGQVVLGFYDWGRHLDALKLRIGDIPADAYWRAPKIGIKTAFLCIDALDEVGDWASAASDAPLIVDALYKVQRLYDYALELNNRVIDWTIPE